MLNGSLKNNEEEVLEAEIIRTDEDDLDQSMYRMLALSRKHYLSEEVDGDMIS